MSDPITFDTKCPRFGLPLLFAGQSQKEAFVNEAHALTDAILHCSIESEASTPPASPVDGQNWLVGALPSGVWLGHAGNLACRQGGNWLFIEPRDGLRILDKSSGQERLFRGSWFGPTAPVDPIGGTTIDSQARAAISALIAALRQTGVFPAI